MNKIDIAYQDLLKDILENGTRKETRNGQTISVFGRQIRHKMSEGFPLLTTKKIAFKTMVTELLWFLRGDTNIKYLVENGCHIWDGDAYKRYANTPIDNIDVKHKYKLPSFGDIIYKPNDYVHYTQQEFINHIKTDSEFAAKWGELGPIYGKQWRAWEHFIRTGEPIIESVDSEDTVAVSITPQGIECEIDQIENLIKDLKANPDSRRLMVSAWNVGEIDSAVLPPCHYGFQVYTRELSLKERCDAYLKWSNDPKCIEWKNHIENEMGWDYENPEWVFNEVKEQLDKAQFPSRAISLMWNQRSVDTFLGLPFNIASYALLLEIIAKEVNMVPDELIGNLGDVHLYSNHVEQAKEQIGRELSLVERAKLVNDNDVNISLKIGDATLAESILDRLNVPKHTREPMELPELMIIGDLDKENFKVPIDELEFKHFKLINYKSHPAIKAPLSN